MNAIKLEEKIINIMSEENKIYENVIVEDTVHKFSTLLWDKETKVVKYAIGSFLTRQLLDQCLSNFQKGISIRCNKEHLYTKSKGYVAKVAKAADENKCDGVHALFYNTSENIIRVYTGENEIDKIYEWLVANTQSGLIPDWKDYLYDELKSQELITECVGFDYTGKAPKILVMKGDLIDKNKATNLIRNIKSYGLKKGYISLPVKENKELPQDMSFLDIIQNLIIPYIKDQECHYNIGEPISPILKSPIVSGEKKYALYPRQQIIAQGMLNAIKSKLPYTILCGGMGLGKTYISIKLAWAVMQEHFKKDNGKISVTVPSHLINKWIREFKECLNPLGVYPNFYIINSFTDVKKIPRVSKGLDILILPKDRIKRSYLVEHSEKNKFSYFKRSDIYKTLSDIESSIASNEDIIIREVQNIRNMKLISILLEKLIRKKVFLYTPYHKDGVVEGYYISTTSETIKNLLSPYKTNKAYEFKVDWDLQKLKNLIYKNISTIKNEEVKDKQYAIKNPTVCPHCGGILYEKSHYIFDEEKWDEYNRTSYSTVTSRNIYCTAYIKADGTPLTNEEINYIRRGITDYKVVKEKYPYAYINDDGEPIVGEELQKIKRNPKNITILLKVCGEKIVGAKNQKGYRCMESTKLLLKKLGKGGIDVNIIDEFHLYANSTNQGNSFANICRLGKVNIPMTGSLTSGRASDLFKLMFRLCPSKMLELGYSYKDESLFVDHFGRKQQEITIYHDRYSKSGVKQVRKPWKELPGISPMLYNLLLSNHMVARTIEDLNVKLPTIKYYKHEIDMTEELRKNYNELKNDFIQFIKNFRGVSLGGSYINNLICYPDMPIQNPIYANVYGEEVLVSRPKCLDIKDKLLPKEKKLIDTISKEIAEDRRVLVYASFTGEKGVSKRLVEVLSKFFRVAELKGSKVKLEKREEWIEKEYQKGTQVIITNPECVSTGLNIIQYPTIYFYEMPLNTKTLRQAERRSYRPNSVKDVKIYYSYYKDTLQQDIILLQSQKKKASLALEGQFSEDLLSQMASGGETIEAMLNKILQGKMKLKESELDDFDFDEEEVSFTFKNTIDENVEVTRTVTEKKSIVVIQEDVTSFRLFTADEEFRKKYKKKKAAPVEGQIGFLL